MCLVRLVRFMRLVCLMCSMCLMCGVAVASTSYTSDKQKDNNQQKYTGRTNLSELPQAFGLLGPELVHLPLQVLEVALDGVPFFRQEAVPLRIFLDILRYLRLLPTHVKRVFFCTIRIHAYKTLQKMTHTISK